MERDERIITPQERHDLDEVLTGPVEAINPEVLRRVMGYSALEYYVPVDPMDDLQCDSCQ